MVHDTVHPDMGFNDRMLGICIKHADLKSDLSVNTTYEGLARINDLVGPGFGSTKACIQKGQQKGIKEHGPGHVTVNEEL